MQIIQFFFNLFKLFKQLKNKIQQSYNNKRLRRAVLKANIEQANYYLNKGANPNQNLDKNLGHSLLEYALYEYSDESLSEQMATLLLKNSVDLNQGLLRAVFLLRAVLNGDVEKAEYYLSKGVNPNQNFWSSNIRENLNQNLSGLGFSLLECASGADRSGFINKKMVKLLLENKAEPDLTFLSLERISPFNKKIVKLLLENEAKPNLALLSLDKISPFGKTPLMCAIQYANCFFYNRNEDHNKQVEDVIEITKMLIRAGASIDYEKNMKTLLRKNKSYYQVMPEVLDLLIAAGALLKENYIKTLMRVYKEDDMQLITTINNCFIYNWRKDLIMMKKEDLTEEYLKDLIPGNSVKKEKVAKEIMEFYEDKRYARSVSQETKDTVQFMTDITVLGKSEVFCDLVERKEKNSLKYLAAETIREACVPHKKGSNLYTNVQQIKKLPPKLVDYLLYNVSISEISSHENYVN